MNFHERRDEIARLNEEPLNQAALAFLPDEFRDPYRLHILSLALWGVEGQLASGNLAVRVEDLVHEHPAKALAFVERIPGSHDFHLLAEHLETARDARAAAYRVLDATYCSWLREIEIAREQYSVSGVHRVGEGQ